MTATPATPAKLRSGEWGARVVGATVAEGTELLITTRGGKSWPARVVKVVWSGDGVTLCATKSLDGGPPGAAKVGRGCECADDECCGRHCRCDSSCNCRGGNIYNC